MEFLRNSWHNLVRRLNQRIVWLRSNANQNFSEEDICLTQALYPLMSMADICEVTTKLNCKHERSTRYTENFLGRKKMVFGLIFRSASYLAMVTIIILPDEKTENYCGSALKVMGEDTIVTKAFLLEFLTVILITVNFISFQNHRKIKLNIEEMIPHKDEIQEAKLLQRKMTAFVVYSTAIIYVALFLFIYVYVYPVMARDSGESLGLFCSTSLILFITIMLYSVYCGGALLILFIILIKRRWDRLLQESENAEKYIEDIEAFMCHIQHRYYMLYLQINEFNDKWKGLILLLYFSTIGLATLLAFILIYRTPDSVGAFLYFTAIFILLLISVVTFTFGALVATVALNVAKNGSALRLKKLTVNQGLRLLNFMKWFGQPVALEAWDLLVTKDFSIKLCEAMFSSFRTVMELNTIGEKKRICNFIPLRNNNLTAEIYQINP